MAVLPFEGRFPILYGSHTVPIGSDLVGFYLARPDTAGAYPAVLLLHDIMGITSLEKDLARRLARQGYVALVVDLYRRLAVRPSDLDGALDAYESVPDLQALRDLDQAYEFLQSDDVDFVEKGRVGVIGYDVGGRLALVYAAERSHVGCVVVAYAPLGGDQDRERSIAEALPRVGAPVLGLFGDNDDKVPPESVDTAAALNLSGQWLLYQGAAHDFLNIDAPEYDPAAANDADARIIQFLQASMPVAAVPVAG